MFKNYKNKGVIKISAYFAGAIFLFIADRLLKTWVLAELYNRKITVMKKIFSLELFKNENIAFSVYLPPAVTVTAIFIIIAALTFTLIVCLVKKSARAGATEAALLLIIMGAASNLYDRLQYNYVIDYLNLVYWPVFNLADVMISAGIIVLAIGIWKNKT